MGTRRPVVGLITIGQAPRVDVVPDMAAILGPGVEVREAGALDGLARSEIDALAPGPGDEILVTRLADGGSAFVAKRHVTPRIQARIAELERKIGQQTVEVVFLKRALQHVEEERRLRAWDGGAASTSKSRRNGKAARS